LKAEAATFVPRTGPLQTVIIFGAAGLLLFIATGGLIPWFSTTVGVEPVVAWFLIGGLCVFAPLILLSWLMLRREQRNAQVPMATRLRLSRMSRSDWAWALGGLIVIGVLSVAIQMLLQAIIGEVDLQPPFMSLEPLSRGRYWILAAWLPVWVLNILGEELLWRGVVLPRQEAAFGRHAWLVNGLGWLLFHVAFGWHLITILIPIVFVLPYVVQRRRNTTIGVVLHAGLNGPGFIAVALGLG
jgi:membrane protease YdiL (CAAX protease family)